MLTITSRRIWGQGSAHYGYWMKGPDAASNGSLLTLFGADPKLLTNLFTKGV